MYSLQFICISIGFIYRLFIQGYKAHKYATTYLQQIEQQFNGKFTASTFKKVVNSHKIYITLVDDAFTQLHGRNTNSLEKECDVNYFICCSLFDDFWDEKELSKEQIYAISFYPKQYNATTFNEKAFIASHLFLQQHVTNLNAYLSVFEKVVYAQEASMQQFNAAITNDELKYITFEKGGNSVLLCRYYLTVPATQQEEHCWYAIGTLIQLGNDLFDIHKDLQQGSHTLATRCTNVQDLQAMYQHQIAVLKNNLYQFSYAYFAKLRFSIHMSFTYSLGLVALQQLQTIQGNNKQLPLLHTLPRKALIVDMQKWSNLCRWIQLTYKYAKL